MKKDVKNAQEMISNEWKKMNHDVQELERLYQVYEQYKDELAQERKTLKNQQEIQLREIEKKKRELYEEEKRLKNEKRILRKQQEQLEEEREEFTLAEKAFEEEMTNLLKEKEYLERGKAKSEVKLEYKIFLSRH